MSSLNARRLATLPPLETLMSFEAVARLGSFTRAAQELSITQSAASKLRAAYARAETQRSGAASFPRTAPAALAHPSHDRVRARRRPYEFDLHRLHARCRALLAFAAVECVRAALSAYLDRYPRDQFDQREALHRSHVRHPVRRLEVARRGAALSRDRLSRLQSRVLRRAGSTHPRSSGEGALIHLDSTEWDCLDWRDWFAAFSFDFLPSPFLTFNQTGLMYEATRLGLGIGLGLHREVRRRRGGIVRHSRYGACYRSA